MDPCDLERAIVVERRQDPGSLLASMVFPIPGGPASRRLWPPAAAISSTRRARSWPRTSARSGNEGERSSTRCLVPLERRTRRALVQVVDGFAQVPEGTGSIPASATSAPDSAAQTRR